MENLSPHIIRNITKELQALISDSPDGIRVIMNENNVLDIQAFVEGPVDTPFVGGTFRVKLCLSKEFPANPPRAFFLTKIFHPNVAPNGEICVNTLKKDWKPDLGIKHILLTIKCLLIVPNPESALNPNAAKLLLDDYDEYFKRASMMTEIHAQTSKLKMAKKDCVSPQDKKLAEKIKQQKKKYLKRL